MRKKILTTAIVMTLSLMSMVMVGAMTLWYASKGRRGAYVYVEAQFNGSVKTSTTQYGLKKNKYVKKVTISLKEGPSYNKTKSTKKSNSLISLKKINNPLYTSYAKWNWDYK